MLNPFFEYGCYRYAFFCLFFNVVFAGWATTGWTTTIIDGSKQKLMPFEFSCCEDPLPLDQTKDESWFEFCCLKRIPGTKAEDNCNSRYRDSCTTWVDKIDHCVVGRNRETQYQCPFMCQSANKGMGEFYDLYIPQIGKIQHYFKECKAPDYACDACTWEVCTKECDARKEYMTRECHITGNTECTACRAAFTGRYLKSAVSCSHLDGGRNYFFCDQCTKPTEYNTIEGKYVNCASFNKYMGRPPGIDDSTAKQRSAPRGTNYCLPCTTCKEEYKNGMPLYFAQSYAPEDVNSMVNCVTVPKTQCVFTHLTIDNKPSKEPMIFKYGMKRVPGSRTRSVETLTSSSRDTLPVYVKCDEKLTKGYRPRNETILNQNITIYNNYVSFQSEIQDCSEQYIGECDTGYYVSRRSENQIICEKCQNADKSPGGFMEYCKCPQGYANKSAIQSALLQIAQSLIVKTSSSSECVSCLDKVFFSSDDVSERISCSSNGEIKRCKPNEYIPDVNSGCQACPIGAIPKINKNGCQRCLQGKYSNGTDCVPCDPSIEYCPVDGMTAPTPKNTSCPSGKLFVSTPQSNTINNRCEECPAECQGETYIVFATGHNQSNGCSQSESERTYFTCYDPTKTNTKLLDSGEKYRTIYDYDPVGKRSFITIDGCNKYIIPEHAEWVEEANNQGDKQCVFACRHGWNALLGDELLSRIRQMVYYNPDNEHLQSFLKGIEKPIEDMKPAGSTVEKKVNWPDNKKYNHDDDIKWERTMDANKVWDSTRGRYYKLKNTFLFVDQIMTEIQSNLTFMQGLCLSPTDAYERGMGCPVGFTVVATIEEFSNLNCALEARKGAIFSIINPTGESYDYVNAILTSDNKIQCAMKSYEDTKWIPYNLCQSCLDQKYHVMDGIGIHSLSARNLVRRKYMLSWLDRTTWQDYFILKGTEGISLPYEFIKSNCETIAHARKFFSIEMEDDYAPGVRASLPCDLTKQGSSFCSKMFGEQYGYDVSGTCAYDGSPCKKCNASMDLVPVIEANAWLKSSGLWDRSNWPLESQVCKYSCDVNYTSNKDWKTYGVTPCIPCDNITQQFFIEGMSGCKTKGGGQASYFNVEDAMEKCAGGLRISEYTPQCSACSPINTPEQLVFSTERLFASNEECLALCPPDLYRTIILNETSQLEEETLKPVKQNSIFECRLCVDEHVIACNNSNCSEGYFRFNETECVACNTSSCTVPGFYRTLCPQNSISDSFCAACDERELLYNNYEAAMAYKPSALLWRALNESQLDRSRRWPSYNQSLPSVFMSEEGCAVTCVNNYVWIDFSTGKPPQHTNNILKPHYACVPCNSDFVRIPLATTALPLYSVWNYSGVMVPHPNPKDKNSVFAQMQKNNMTGGCYLCPPNTNTIPEVDIMCQTIPGFGKSSVMGVPVGITTRSIEAKAITLETSEAFQTVFYMSKRTPVVSVSDTVYFTCCRNNDQACKVFEKKEIDKDQSILLGSGSFYGQCTNNLTGARYARRLLEEKGEIPLEKCLVGQYNHRRGGTVCFDCPLGASTVEPYHGVDAKGKCKCLPGYYAIRNAKEILERCEPCGFNRHRTVHVQNDTLCEACPQGKVTPSETSTNCYCEAGSYPKDATSCIQCESGGYCESGALRVACPENSWSAHGARSRSDCVCRKEEGFYGSLANPGSVCHKVPPTMQCEGGKCECAVGWYPVYNTSVDGLVTVMRCMTECSLGHYAVIHPSTFQKLDCKPCPLNTYSSSRQTIYAGEGRTQCTPCPVNFQTKNVGSVAPSQCACLRGVKNTTTSECGSCPANTYLSVLQGECMMCPAGATSAVGSVGFSSCLCPKGSHATFGDGLQCEACPLNTYAASAGFSCTRCPKGMVTLAEGSTSLRHCVCSGGKLQYAGMCV